MKIIIEVPNAMAAKHCADFVNTLVGHTLIARCGQIVCSCSDEHAIAYRKLCRCFLDGFYKGLSYLLPSVTDAISKAYITDSLIILVHSAKEGIKVENYSMDWRSLFTNDLGASNVSRKYPRNKKVLSKAAKVPKPKRPALLRRRRCR